MSGFVRFGDIAYFDCLDVPMTYGDCGGSERTRSLMSLITG
jgi:hypothetical protein